MNPDYVNRFVTVPGFAETLYDFIVETIDAQNPQGSELYRDGMEAGRIATKTVAVLVKLLKETE